MSIELRAAAALKWTALGRLLAQSVTWVITLIVLRLLRPEDYGLMALVSVVIAISASIAEFGLGASMIQAKELPPPLLRRMAGFVLMLHLGLGIVLVLMAPFVAMFFDEPRLVALIRVAALQFPLIAIGAVPQALATRELRFKWLAKLEFGTSVASALLVLLLAWSGFGVWALLLGQLAGAGLRSALLVTGAGFVRPDFRMQGLRAHVSFGSKYALSTVAWAALIQIDTVVGGRFLTRDDLGAYAVAVYLATLPMNKIMGVINQVAFTTVARLQDESERLRMRLLQSLRLMGAAGVPLLWGLSAVAPEAVRVLLGERWEPAIVPLQLICIIVPLRLASALLGTALGGVGAAGASLRCTLVAAVVWPLCFLAGVQRGVDGLALSWLVAVPLTFALNSSRFAKHLRLGFSETLKQLSRAMVAGAAMYGCVLLARIVFADVGDLVRLPVLIAVGAASYLPLLWLLDRSIVGETRRMFAAMRG